MTKLHYILGNKYKKKKFGILEEKLNNSKVPTLYLGLYLHKRLNWSPLSLNITEVNRLSELILRLVDIRSKLLLEDRVKVTWAYGNRFLGLHKNPLNTNFESKNPQKFPLTLLCYKHHSTPRPYRMLNLSSVINHKLVTCYKHYILTASRQNFLNNHHHCSIEMRTKNY